MRLPSLTPALACLPVILAADSSSAQAPRPASQYTQTVSVSTGLTFTDRLDATASPRPFAGMGTAGSARYRFETDAWSVTAEGAGSSANYQPRDDLAGSEWAMSGGMTVNVDRQAFHFGAASMRIGATIDTRAELLEHHYADVASTVSSFVSGFATLGPSVSLERALGAGNVIATAAIPVVGLVHQPYANIRQEREPITFRAADASALHGGSLGVRYETSRTARVGVVAEYHAKAFAYTGGWSTRSFTNATSLGFVARFGSKAH